MLEQIEAREKPIKKDKNNEELQKQNLSRGRPKKGFDIVKEPTRERCSGDMSLDQMLEDLPKDWCLRGSKKLSQGSHRNLGRLQASYRHS
jgi:hypothetical protein